MKKALTALLLSSALAAALAGQDAALSLARSKDRAAILTAEQRAKLDQLESRHGGGFHGGAPTGSRANSQ
jgi:hypothetical protein